MELISIIQTNIISIIVGMLSAFIFLIFLFTLFRPWFLISGKICKVKDGFKFKMINLTPFKCIDFNIYLRQIEKTDLIKGHNLNYKILENKENPFIYVPSVFAGFKGGRSNCLQMFTKKDVKDIIETDGTYVELILISKHGLSGIQTIYRKKFKHPDCIKSGKFNRGFSFSVV
jgi:hypothetical protein